MARPSRKGMVIVGLVSGLVGGAIALLFTLFVTDDSNPSNNSTPIVSDAEACVSLGEELQATAPGSMDELAVEVAMDAADC